ncbi:MAG: SPOR domain-containing protein [Lachnospiraceae bacterium]|nr:SPOR domain-containing protein [Lachnospiraceae bacterium]
MIRKISISLLCAVCLFSVLNISPVSGSVLKDTKATKTSAASKQKGRQNTETKDTDKGTKQSIAERICGKYSYYDDENEEFNTLSFVTFGDNLYAYAGLSYGEEDQKEDLDVYSYWVAEFIPDDKDTVTSTDSDSAEVNALYFSNMSMLSKYQGDAVKGTIKLTKDGLVLDGFGAGKTIYTQDDRANDAFPYLDRKASAGDKDLQGYWRLKDSDCPVYLFFDGNNMYIYEKLPGTEVSFFAGSCSTSGKKLSGNLSNPVSSGMPYALEAEFTVKKGVLTILGDPSCELDMFIEGAEFEKIDREDVPVITAEEYITPEIDPDADPDLLYMSDPDLRPFYGVFVSSTKDREAAIKTATALCDKGYDGSVTYTPEWEALNKDPYFVVLAGRFDTKEDADALLKDVKKDGYRDAFVKFSGKSKGIRLNYTTFSPDTVSVRDDSVVIRLSDPVPTFDWSPYYVENGYDTGNAYLYLDGDTVFDKSCDTELFTNYKKGDTVLEWFQRNRDLLNNDADNASYDACTGVFDVNADGTYIDSYYGIYWWDRDTSASVLPAGRLNDPVSRPVRHSLPKVFNNITFKIEIAFYVFLYRSNIPLSDHV